MTPVLYIRGVTKFRTIMTTSLKIKSIFLCDRSSLHLKSQSFCLCTFSHILSPNKPHQRDKSCYATYMVVSRLVTYFLLAFALGPQFASGFSGNRVNFSNLEGGFASFRISKHAWILKSNRQQMNRELSHVMTA